ncbi:hypothetical protein HDU92_006101 [Lobulomyces angularis]|nr:hypothetical protein HDU92_006101 [Lobulomyces angularis]
MYHNLTLPHTGFATDDHFIQQNQLNHDAINLLSQIHIDSLINFQSTVSSASNSFSIPNQFSYSNEVTSTSPNADSIYPSTQLLQHHEFTSQVNTTVDDTSDNNNNFDSEFSNPTLAPQFLTTECESTHNQQQQNAINFFESNNNYQLDLKNPPSSKIFPISPMNSLYSPLSEPNQSPLISFTSPNLSNYNFENSNHILFNTSILPTSSPQISSSQISSPQVPNPQISSPQIPNSQVSSPQISKNSPPITPLLTPLLIPSSPNIQLDNQFSQSVANNFLILKGNKISKNDTLHKCPCGKSFKKIHSLELHSKLHQKDRAYGCDVCFLRFMRPNDLKRHKITHIEGYKPFQCSNCLLNFTRQDAMQRHVHSKRCHVKK